MIWLLCILVGLYLGQHIKITVSPDMVAFFKSTWAQLDKLIGEAIPALSEWRDRAMIAELRGQKSSDAPSIAEEVIGKLRGGTK